MRKMSGMLGHSDLHEALSGFLRVILYPVCHQICSVTIALTVTTPTSNLMSAMDCHLHGRVQRDVQRLV